MLANEIAVNLKYRIGLKQFFNINLGIGIIKKTTFSFCIFDVSPCVFTQISIGELTGCGIKLCIQRVPNWHTFDGPSYPKHKKYLKKHDDDIIITLFSGISYFGGSGARQKYAKLVLVGCKI